MFKIILAVLTIWSGLSVAAALALGKFIAAGESAVPPHAAPEAHQATLRPVH